MTVVATLAGWVLLAVAVTRDPGTAGFAAVVLLVQGVAWRAVEAFSDPLRARAAAARHIDNTIYRRSDL